MLRASIWGTLRALYGKHKSLDHELAVPVSTAFSIREERASAAAILAPLGILRATGQFCFSLARMKARSSAESGDGGDSVPGCDWGTVDGGWVGRDGSVLTGEL